MANRTRPLKKQKIRNSEYYDMQAVFDELYAKSNEGSYFKNLVEIIKAPENIKLAYRNIRKNSGSKTAGVDNKTISDLNKWKESALISRPEKAGLVYSKRSPQSRNPEKQRQNPTFRNTYHYGQTYSAMYFTGVRAYL